MMLGALDALGDAARARARRRARGRLRGRAAWHVRGSPARRAGTRCPSAAASRREAPPSRSRSATPAGSRVLLLVSGGASALLEVPAPGVALEELRGSIEWALVRSRRHRDAERERAALSRVKGGRLPGLFRGAAVEGLMISDVPRDDPAVLGSGLLAPARPAVGTLVGSLDDALDAARACRARRAGLAVARGRSGSRATPRRRRAESATSSPSGEPDLHLCGGETVVRLPARPGRGGRCQHLALVGGAADRGPCRTS